MFKLLLLLLVVLTPQALLAAELKILDGHGLTRAMKNVKSAATVVVTFGAAPSGAVRLSNVDGVASDIQGNATRATSFVFSNVSPGVWQIQTGGSGASIQQVKINK